MELEKTGIVTRVKNIKDFFVLTIADREQFEVLSKEFYNVGDVITAKGETQLRGEILQIVAKEVKKESEEKRKRICDEIEKSVRVLENEPIIKTEVMKKLIPHAREVAKKLLVAKKLNRFTILRFHADADGIVGGIAISSILNAQKFQQNSAIYSVRDALTDINSARNNFMPLVILVDFGANEESISGLELLKADGIETIIIDHHPPAKNIEQYACFLSPWKFGEENASKHTAGYIAIEVARACGMDFEKYVKTSLAGDKSDLLPFEDEDKNKALVLDYLATYSSFGNSLDFYREVMEKPALYESMLRQAKEKLESLKESVKANLKKREKDGITIYLLNLDRIAIKGEFPSRGKITSIAYDMVKGENAIVLGYSEKYIIFRVTDEAAKKVNANEIIEKIKSSAPDFIESGGGHDKAASLKIRKGFEKEILEEIVKII
ncbi:MAG: DHH family phosphoesterase [Candidatus Anstonellales archaeon]